MPLREDAAAKGAVKPKLIYIEWADAISNAQWQTREDAHRWAEASDWIIRSAGWLVEETDEYIIIALGWKPEDDFTCEQFVNLHKIPRTWIRKRKALKV